VGFNLRDYQSEALAAVQASWAEGIHRAGQRVLMHDGSFKTVEDVVVGDRLMGPDSSPRTVLRLCRGTGAMHTVRPVKGEPWTVNGDHVLSLVSTNQGGRFPSQQGGVLVDVTVDQWSGWARYRKHVHKLFRVSVDFPKREEPVLDPYMAGIILGDGSTSKPYQVAVTTIDPEIENAVAQLAASYGLSVRRDGRGDITHHIKSDVRTGRRGGSNPVVTELKRLGLLPIACADKFVPDVYKLGSREVRLAVLAGLLDSDGHHDGRGGFEFASKGARLAADVAFIARSLGLAATVSARPSGPAAGHSRVKISGDTDMVPTRVARKRAPARKQIKDVLRTGFTIGPTGTVEPFYGFTLDGDHRYLLDDFTVTHNSGKTVCFSALIASRIEQLRKDGLRVLVLAHREELLDQAEAKIKAMCPGIWTAVVKGARGADKHRFADVVVASVQTLARPARRASVDRIGMVIVDECHRYASRTYREVLTHYGCMDERVVPTVGFTATLTRMDGGLPDVWQSVAYQKKIHWMIKQGYLVPPVAKSIEVPGLNLATTRVTGGDLNAKDVAAALEDSAAFTAIAEAWCAEASERPTIVFMPDVHTAQMTAEAFRAVCGASVEVVTGSTPTTERRAAYTRFASGETRILVSCMVLTEGFDAPHTSCVVIGRPTLNPGLYIQMVGRGLRLDPASGKTDCLVLDIAGASLKHNLAGVNDLESDCSGRCDCNCLSCGCSDRCKCGIRQCGCRCVEQHEAPSKLCRCAGSDDCSCGCPGDTDGTGLDGCVCSGNDACECRGEGPQLEVKDVDVAVLKTLTEVDILGAELKGSPFQWLTTTAGIRFLAVGNDAHAFLLPAPGGGGYFQGLVEGSGRNADVRRLDGGATEAATAVAAIEAYAESTGYSYNNPKASWRRGAASTGQLGLLRSLGAQQVNPDGRPLSKGQASDAIAVAKVSRQLDHRFGKYVAGATDSPRV
jgi:superfamily II DNA or RNA helicase